MRTIDFLLTKVIQSQYIRVFGMIFFILGMSLVIACDRGYAKEKMIDSTVDLQKAIDQANPNDQLILNKGVYRAPITITKPITIIGKPGAVIEGNGKGNVITITGNNVTLKSLTIRNSGVGKEESGLLLTNNQHCIIENNHFENVQFGIFVDKGINHVIKNNFIKSKVGHFSKRGNGIHLFKGSGHVIEGNEMDHVQDGVYFDFTKNITVKDNHVHDSRYGLHYMFSSNIDTVTNELSHNITGLMIMDSKELLFKKNRITDQFHFRGYGLIVYDSKNIKIEENDILRNSTGVSLEMAKNATIKKNVIAANQVGLEFKGENLNDIFTENNFIGNIVQSKIGTEEMQLDNGKLGNYWDEYSSFDVTGDGIGEVRYKAGSLYDQLLQKRPYWQFYFESPSIKLWSKADSLFPSIGKSEVYDAKPVIEPFPLQKNSEQALGNRNIYYLIIGLTMLLGALLIMLKGRKF